MRGPTALPRDSATCAGRVQNRRDVNPPPPASLSPPRYSGMISELENAKKQTWEEKAKLSAVFEEERRQLVRCALLLSLHPMLLPWSLHRCRACCPCGCRLRSCCCTPTPTPPPHPRTPWSRVALRLFHGRAR